jgi:hypothetical protein
MHVSLLRNSKIKLLSFFFYTKGMIFSQIVNRLVLKMLISLMQSQTGKTHYEIKTFNPGG